VEVNIRNKRSGLGVEELKKAREAARLQEEEQQKVGWGWWCL